MANRLSENPEINVLLLEAGPRPTTIHTVPAYAIYADRPQDRWGFTLNSHPGSCLVAPNQQCIYPLGKLLGGSSSLNYLIYARGNRLDYDRWAEMGNNGWSFDDVFPLFQMIENATEVEDRDYVMRGIEGPLTVGNSNYRTTVAESYIEAVNSVGVPSIDYNGASQIGVGYTQATIRNGRRQSAVNAYLDLIKHRKNLHVMINSLVSRVIIDPITKTAQGVEYIHQGQSYQVFTTKEVILSAGPIMSPTLLMLSGIGDRKELGKFNIPVIKELPVGRKYLDHTVSGGFMFMVNTTGQNLNYETIDTKDAEEFVEKGTGKLTVPSTIEVITFLNNGVRSLPLENPEVEFTFTSSKNEFGFAEFPVLRQDIYNSILKPIEDPSFEVYHLSIIDLYPSAQGKIQLRGPSINNPPIIEYPFFENPKDMETIIKSIKFIVSLTKTPAMRKLGAQLYTAPIPDCASLKFGTDLYWECHIRHFSRNVCHAAATCKMGPKDDREAVVDPELRVYGVKRLRVADTSIAPTTIAGHTQAVGYLVGEKMAMILKQEWEI